MGSLKRKIGNCNKTSKKAKQAMDTSSMGTSPGSKISQKQHFQTKELNKFKKKIKPAGQSREKNLPVIGINSKDTFMKARNVGLSADKQLLVKPGSKWYEQVPTDPVEKASTTNNVLQLLKKEAEGIYVDDTLRYKKFLERRKEKADFIWMRTILQSGTLSDKISAHTLLIQDSPVYNFSSIEILVAMVNPKGKRECLMALDCLKDLFLSDLLIEEKKLKTFAQHPLEKLDQLCSGNIVSRKKRLLLWCFEDKLKVLFEKFVKNLESVSRDTVEKTKQKSVTVMFELLRYNPEQEQFLLEHLVNKIGDPIPKVGSHVCHLLGQLVNHHRNMTAVIVQEVERLLFRQNVAERAKYYCLCFLNQLIFDHEEPNVPNHLITMYFGLFKMCIKKGEVNSKMMSALLTGVGRAYPYAKMKNYVIMDQLDAMFKLVHMVSFNISVQTLMLIFQVLDSKDSISDRFYSTLYRKILDPGISSSSRQSMLLNLIYRALKKDAAQVRVKAFVKRLIQVSIYQAPNLQSGILILISELSKTHPGLLDTKKALVYSDSDSEEHYDDAPDEDSDPVNVTRRDKVDETQDGKKMNTQLATSSSWVHRQSEHHKKRQIYDPQDRNPLHAGAEFCNLWELCFLKKSFHPSVSLFAHQISTGRQIIYDGDPLADFTVIRFLDRFVYRNPKKLPESAKANVHRKVFGRKVLSMDSKKLPVTSESYIHQNEDKIPVEERFIYRYLRQRAKRAIKTTKADSDVESVNSDEFESLLNNIHPEDEGKDTLDFAKELSVHKKQPARDKGEGSSASELESLESESDLEEGMDFDKDEEFQNAFKDFDEDILNLDTQGTTDLSAEDFVDFEEFEGKPSGKQGKKSKKGHGNDGNIFASADELGALLDDNATYGADGTSEAFLNTDKSAVKQLAWERQRDQFVRGTDWKSRRRNNFRKKSNMKSRKNNKV